MDEFRLILVNMLVLSAPLILAAMGGYVSERSGIVNIGLEGVMLISAIATALGATATHSALLGLLCGLGAAIALSLVHAVMTQAYRIDHIVSGMAVNAIAFGLSNFLDKKFTSPDAKEFVHFQQPFFYLLGIATAVGLAVFVLRARGGVRLLAVGNDPDKARTMGVQPLTVRYVSLVWTGVFAGLAGSAIVSHTGFFVDRMTAGKGFIALAALIVGGWRPIQTLIACLCFGFLQAFEIQFQGSKVFGIDFPSEAWSCLPYAATVLALAGFLGKNRAPAGLGKH